MKTIMYMSQSTEGFDANGLPQSMASIIVNSRRRNRDVDIHSLLCCHRGLYLQVIEGKAAAVDKLFESIQKDFRHKNIKVIIESATSQVFLEPLPFKMATIYQSVETLTRYVNSHLMLSLPLDTSVRAIFNEVRDNRHLPSRKSTKQKSFAGYNLSLTQWPKFDVAKPTQELLELCAMLTRSAVSYESLSNTNPYSSECELNEALYSLQQMSILQLNVEHHASASIATSPFFMKMKKFINRVRA